MTLDGILSQAGSGLDSVTRRLAVVSQNVANASTLGYVRESVAVTSATAGGIGMGVRTGVSSRAMDEFLQADVFAASAAASGQQVTADALKAIDAASGTPGSLSDLPSLLGAVRDSFSQLAADPSNQTQQGFVVQQSTALARGLNSLSDRLAETRQSAHDAAVDDVSATNAALRTVGDLSKRITQAQSRGESTADLEDQRDTSLNTVADLTGARFLRGKGGEILVAAGGLMLPIQAQSGPFSLAPANVGAAGSPATPRLLLNNQDVTDQLTGGRLGAHLALRDTVVPGLQAGVDGFAQTLASRFNASGLTLFTDPAGAVPPASGSAGFASTIRVSAAVEATPSTVRDGAGPVGPAGSATLINTILDTALASGPGSLTAQAQDIASQHAARASEAQARLQTDQGVSTALGAKLATAVGVSVDNELGDLVRFQNAYAANAKVLAATQSIWTDLLNAVR